MSVSTAFAFVNPLPARVLVSVPVDYVPQARERVIDFVWIKDPDGDPAGDMIIGVVVERTAPL